MTGVPVAPHAKIIAAGLVVEIIVETAELAILKAHPSQTGAAGDRGCHDFHNHPDTPLLVTQMIHRIAHPKVESLAFAQSHRFLGAAIKVLSPQGDIRIGRGRAAGKFSLRRLDEFSRAVRVIALRLVAPAAAGRIIFVHRSSLTYASLRMTLKHPGLRDHEGIITEIGFNSQGLEARLDRKNCCAISSRAWY